MKEIKECPICGGNHFSHYMDVKDHMITQEQFSLSKCDGCGFVFTNPIPTIDKIGDYYKSENYVSHSSTNKGLINKVYQRVRKKTLAQKKQIVDSYGKVNSLLDIGCGTGHFLKYLSDFDYNLLGLEPDEDARQFAIDSGVNAKPLSDLHQLDNESWDAITMWHVLEHVYDLRKDFEKFSNLLVKGGRFFIAVPNHLSYDAQCYKENWAAYDVPRHLYHFREKDVIELGSQFGLKHIETLPMKYDAYYVSMLSEQYINGSKAKAYFKGKKSNKMASENGFSSQIYVLKKD